MIILPVSLVIVLIVISCLIFKLISNKKKKDALTAEAAAAAGSHPEDTDIEKIEKHELDEVPSFLKEDKELSVERVNYVKTYIRGETLNS